MNPYIDFNHWQGAIISDQILSNEQNRANLQLIQMLNPRFCREGNQFCFILGEMPECFIAGFGNTVNDAVNDFAKAYHTQNP